MYSRFNSRNAVSAIVGYRVNIIPEKLFLIGHVWKFLRNVIQAEGSIKLKNRWRQYRPAILPCCPTASDRLEAAAREVCVCTQSFCFSAKCNVHNSNTRRKNCHWNALDSRWMSDALTMTDEIQVPCTPALKPGYGNAGSPAQFQLGSPVVSLRPPSHLIFLILKDLSFGG